MAIDPVCGMQIDERTATGNSQSDGRAYYFCSAACKKKFDATPSACTGMQPAADVPPAHAHKHDYGHAQGSRTVPVVKPAAAAPGTVHTCPTHPEIELFTEGDTLYAAMLASIRSARHRVWMESYLFAGDEIGRVFADTLAECAQSGVEVRVQLDAAGAFGRGVISIVRHLRAHGVAVKWFHRWNWHRPLRYNRRNHRKLLVIDDRTAYIGGFNIHRESSRRVFGEARWRDRS